MAIPQGQMSSEVVESAWRAPENRRFYATISYELGPLAREDTSEGLLYQNWTLRWAPETGDVTLTPESTGLPEVIANIPSLVSITFTFDQNARVTYTYTTAVSSYIYWYDTSLGMTVTTDIGADCITPAVLLDDKRDMQSTASDMLLWYTKADGFGKFNLYMLRQRDRFLTEYLMDTDLEMQYIHNIGMNSNLRLQLAMKDVVPIIPYS